MPQGTWSLKQVGRYVIHREIAAGGMATVSLGRMRALGGAGRTVAVKRLLEPLARDADFAASFLDEGRLAMRIRHANVVQTLDVLAADGELLLVMEYVHGVTLSQLVRGSAGPIQPRVVVAVVSGMLRGLHAAHEVTDERGMPLELVHRDVSPQNVLVGTDGVARVLDFGVAKAEGRLQVTRQGEIKGKLSYMAPEQIRGAPVARSADVFAAGVMLWELLVGRDLFRGVSQAETLARVLTADVVPPSVANPAAPAALDALVMQCLERDPAARPSSARALADALEAALPAASAAEVGAWVEQAAKETLDERAAIVAEMEGSEYLAPSRELLASALAESTPSAGRAAAPRSTEDVQTARHAPAQLEVVGSPEEPPRVAGGGTRRVLWAAGLSVLTLLGGGLALVAALRGDEPTAALLVVEARAAEGPLVAPRPSLALAVSAAPVTPSTTSRASSPAPRRAAVVPVPTATAAPRVPKPCKTVLVWNPKLSVMEPVKDCPP